MMISIFFLSFLFIPGSYIKNSFSKYFSNESKLLLSYQNNLIKFTNFLTIIGSILCLKFFLSNLTGFGVLDIALFANAYRGGNYAGSGLYTGIIIYLLPLIISYLILEGISYKKIIFPFFVIVIVSFILGLRVFILLPMVSYIIRILESIFNSESTKFFNSNPEVNSRKKFNFIVLVTIAIFVVVIPKLILSTKMQDAYSITDKINSILGRFDYKTLESSYSNSSMNGLGCFTPIINKFATCDLSQFKYIVHAPIVGFEDKGNPLGWEIPLIPLIYLLKLNFLEIATITILGCFIINGNFYFKNLINKKLSTKKPLQNFLFAYIRFFKLLLPLIIIKGVFFDYHSAMTLFEIIFCFINTRLCFIYKYIK